MLLDDVYVVGIVSDAVIVVYQVDGQLAICFAASVNLIEEVGEPFQRCIFFLCGAGCLGIRHGFLHGFAQCHGVVGLEEIISAAGIAFVGNGGLGTGNGIGQHAVQCFIGLVKCSLIE